MTASVATRRRTSWPARLGTVLRFLLPFVALIAAWQLAVLVTGIGRNFLPPPIDVFRAFREEIADGALLESLWISLTRLVKAAVIASLTGIALGLVMGLSRATADFLEPVTSFFNSISGIVWVPIAIVWFGLGEGAITFVLWNSIFWVVLYNTMLGARAVPRTYYNATRTMGARRIRAVRDVIVPGALPNVMLGVRLGVGFGWRALIAAEMVGAPDGIGRLIFRAADFQQPDVVLTGIFAIGMLWLAMDYLLLRPVERRTVERWGTLRVAGDSAFGVAA